MSRTWKVTWGLVAAVVAVFLLVFFVWPVLAMLGRGFVAEPGASLARGLESIDLSGFWATISSVRTWKIVWQTLWMAAAATVGSLFIGVPAAYVLYQLRFPGRTLARIVVAVPFALPSVVVGTAFRALLSQGGPLGFLGIGETSLAVVAAMIFFNVSVIVRVVGPVWAGLDPGQVAAARTLGANAWRAFFTVTLVQLGPALAGGAALVFLFCSTSFGLVQTLGRPGYGTLESEIYVQTTAYFDLQTAGALSLLQFAVVGLAIYASTRWRASTQTSLTLRADTSISAHGPRRWYAALLSIGVVLFVALPMLALVLGALDGPSGYGLYYFHRLGESGTGFSGGASVREALENSLRIAVDATILALAIGVPAALVVTRPVRSKAVRAAQNILEGVSLLPLGISAVTVGFGYLITWGSRVDSTMLVPVVQAVVALPLVLRTLTPLLRSIDNRQRYAASTLGASPWQILATIDLPILSRGIGQAAAFSFAISLGEFGATSFLASPDFQTLPVLIGRLLSRPGADNYGMALAGALLLGILTATTMAIAELLAPRTNLISTTEPEPSHD